MENEPVWVASIRKSIGLAAASFVVAFLAKDGVTLDAGTAAELAGGVSAVLITVELVVAKLVRSKVTSDAKIEARLAVEHPAAFAALKRPS